MSIQENTRDGAQDRNGKGAVTDEQVLVMRAKSGNSSAFGELYERHRLKSYRSAFRILRNSQDAEDAMQQSFQRAFTSLNQFRGDSAFATWMTSIVINEALMILRRRRVTTPLFETNGDHVDATSPIDAADGRLNPEQSYAEKEIRSVVVQAISRLRKSWRAVAQLRELQGLTYAETALRLGLTVSAVKARAHHARRYLRRHLERKYKAARYEFLIRARNNN